MRFAELDRDTLTERQRETYDRIASGPRQAVRGPFPAWIRSPVFADCAEVMGNYLRFDSSLPKRIKELAILMVARSWHASFVWNAHIALAREAGLTEETIEAIRCGRLSLIDGAEERIAGRFLGALLDDKSISDQAWLDAVDRFGERGVVDLLGISGYYGMVAMTIVATNLGADLLDPFVMPQESER